MAVTVKASPERSDTKTQPDVPKPDKQHTPAPSEAAAVASQSDSKPVAPATSNAPLAPPPRPSQNGPSDTPDYFNTVHNPFSLEPNVFEQSFGNPSLETPGGRPILPPVANITSPNPLPGITPGWQSLRAGPLSPAMLQGPTGDNDYFNQGFRGGFPTPNESSLRTGLTPGGGGSMFPAPSPNSQAIFNLQSGGVTPSTADFQQSALRAAAQANQAKFNTSNGPTSQPEPAQHSYQQPHPQQQAQRGQQDIFGPHDVTGAANDLLSFAQATQPTQPNGNRSNGQFAVPNQPAHINNTMGHMPVQMPQEQQQTHHHAAKGSVNSMTGSVDTGDLSESGRSEQAKPSTRSRNKKGGNAKTTAGSRRKADDAPKGGANKKQKGNSGSVQSHTADEDSDLDMDNMKEELNEHGKKMTDEEKRKNFLERNRVAALKCRQRKKQWLANLQNKVEVYGTENDALSAQVTQLREEIVNLKSLLLAHKDCAIGQAQGLNQLPISQFLTNDMGHHQNPYGMAGMQSNGVPMGMAMQQGQMNRR